ncbi:glycosyltransferase family 8 protein [Baudoinia panamericana UAMH 10762]|uniref:Glycosyltransferase family 8 protein n=1 Tax=Baudoinia panamericana (strain UAMH 10762) TaxID=717646 RepID=M2NAM2_BAUPA|nr:glycosyltransferase family 8 protein [Baudoinia panamericana UAMH 10762]EMC95895.1 glycosyltransferase family 8 protein [Baudoinia panamericana UAMH 10762]
MQRLRSMPGAGWSDKDEDDYGMPVHRQAQNTITWSLRRARRYGPLIGIVLLFLLYWSWPQSLTRTDWSKYAYVQYATDEHNLCNALMVFESLHRHGSKAQRVLLHNPQWASLAQGADDRQAHLLSLAQRKYHVNLRPVQLLDERGEPTQGLGGETATWDTSITKLRAFELTEYERVLHIDSDVTLLQHMDELFLLPSTAVAMPRAYWSDGPPEKWPLTSMLILLQPSRTEFKHMLATLRSWWMESEQTRTHTKQYDMELLNHRFGASAMVLPHRPYALLSAEFRRENHAAYLGTINAPTDAASEWDPDRVLKEAKIVHFSDWPLPKPWVMWPHDALAEIQPNCTNLHGGATSCREREIWKELYDDFRRRRKDVCRLLSMPAPDWRKHKEAVGAA